MAWNFDGGDAVFLDNGLSTVLPDNNWAFGGFIRFSERTGTVTRYIIRGGIGYSSAFFIRIGDASAAIAPDNVNIAFLDDDGTAINGSSTGDPFASNTSWTYLHIQRVGTTITVYVNGSSVLSGSNANLDVLTPNSDLQFGNEQYFSGGFRGDMADWAKWNRDLSLDEITRRASGVAANCFPQGLAFYLPMIRDYNEIRAGLTVENDGTVVSEHPRLIYCGE